MTSHHEWVEEVTAKHNAEKPFAPENGQTLRFAIGDEVVYTNDYGVQFKRTVTGFYQPTGPCGQYALGARYFVDSDCPWMPVRESQLTPFGGAA